MLNILIVEGNSPQLVDYARSQRQATAAEHYGHTLAALHPELSFEIIEPYRNSSVLSCDYLAQFDGVAFTGAGVSWPTDDAKAAPQRQTMEAVFKANRPTFGSCNGLQLATVVLGGASQASPAGLEIGFAREVQLTPAGQQHPLHQGRSNGFACLCVHRDQIAKLPAGAVVTAENHHSIQAMVYEQDGLRFWGVQYHPELSLTQIADYLRCDEGIFSGRDALLEQIETAQQDPSTAASVLGVEADELDPVICGTELQNWLRSL